MKRILVGISIAALVLALSAWLLTPRMTCLIAMKKTKFSKGEPIPIQVKLINSGRVAIQFEDPNSLQNIAFEIIDPNGTIVPFRGYIISRAYQHMDPIQLDPGEFFTYNEILNRRLEGIRLSLEASDRLPGQDRKKFKKAQSYMARLNGRRIFDLSVNGEYQVRAVYGVQEDSARGISQFGITGPRIWTGVIFSNTLRFHVR